MSAVNRRRIAAVVGALVGDAAAQPLHWIYSESHKDEIIRRREDVEFWSPSRCPFYKISNGKFTCYGDQVFVILKSLVEQKGVDPEALKKATYEYFGPNSEFEDPDKSSVAKPMPIPRPWRHGSIKEFLANYETGIKDTGSATDDSVDSVVRMIPVCALYVGRPEMLVKVEEVLRVTQTAKVCIDTALTAARVLELFIKHGDKQEVLQQVMADLGDNTAAAALLDQVKDVLSQDHNVAVTRTFSPGCGLPKAFQAALHGAVTAKDYQQALRSTIKVIGCNASRACFIGACAAAKFGLDAVPESWQKNTTVFPEALQLAEELIKIILI